MKDLKKNKNKYNLIEVIIVMIVTSIFSITITIIVSYAINNTSKKIKYESDFSDAIAAYQLITDEYYEKIDKTKLVNSAIEGMIDYLDDPYSVFISEEDSDSLKETLDGEYVGIGAKIIKNKDGLFFIYDIFDNSPAMKSGLKIGDQIIKIESVEVVNKSSEDLVSLIKGKKNSVVDITIKREDEELNYKITRGNVEIPSVSYKVIELNEGNIAVVRINNFASNTYNQFKNIINDLSNKKIDGLILDLRNNFGGYLTSAQSIIEMFVEKDSIMYQLDKKGSISKITNKKHPIIKYKTAILVNKSTASASEILTASLKENLGINVIGTKTYGKGKVQKIRNMSDGSLFKYTIQNWITPNGLEIDGNGISPTLEINLDKKYLDNPSDENDNQLQAAINTIFDK